MVKVHHCLCGSGSDDTRFCPAFEVYHVFACACCNKDCIAFVMFYFISDFDGYFFLRI